MDKLGLRPWERQGALGMGWARAKWTAGTLRGLSIQPTHSFSLRFLDIKNYILKRKKKKKNYILTTSHKKSLCPI